MIIELHFANGNIITQGSTTSVRLEKISYLLKWQNILISQCDLLFNFQNESHKDYQGSLISDQAYTNSNRNGLASLLLLLFEYRIFDQQQ